MSAQHKVPIRTCVSCRTESGKTELTRVVRGPAGDVRLDPSGKLPGRGAYLCGKKECLAKALKDNKLGRALKCSIPEGVVAELEACVVQDRED